MSARSLSGAAFTVGVALLGMCAESNADEPILLKIASVAPEGSPWARELNAFAREVSGATAGHLKIKLYLNAVAGDELAELDRMRRGQLDGAASGQMACERVAPTLRISHVPGLFQDRAEASAVLTGLHDVIEREAHERGFTILGITGLGPSIFFTRRPVRNLAELRQVRLWRWDLDEVGIVGSREEGLTVAPMPLDAAASAYDRGAVDGFLGIPSAALAFQWSAQAKYLIDLRGDYLFGCLALTERSYARLPVASQAALREAGARLRERYEDLGRRVDDSLIGGLFQRQGMVVLPVSDSFRAEFFAAMRVARERMAERFVAHELLARVQNMLADYRAEHLAPRR